MSALPRTQANEPITYRLTCRSRDGTVQTTTVEDEPVTIGRDPEMDICLDDTAVSRRHCIIIAVPGRLMLLDQGSTNGTRVNGVQVQQARLKHGDVIQIGSAQIEVRADTTGAKSSGLAVRADTQWPIAGHELLPEEQVRFLRRFTTRLSCVDSSAGAAETVLDGAFSVFPAERAFLILASPEDPAEPGVVLAARGLGEVELTISGASLTLIRDALTSSKALHRRWVLPRLPGPVCLQPGVAGHPRNIDALCAPIRLGLQGCCVLYLEGSEMPSGACSDDMIDLLSSIARVAGPAIGRGILLDERTRQRGDAHPGDSESPSDVRGIDRPTQAVSDAPRGITQVTTRVAPAVDSAIDTGEPEQLSVVEEQRIELAAQLAELEHLQETRAQIARGLVHDIKNLVTALDANLALIGSILARDGQGMAFVGNARSCAERIQTLAQNALEVQRMEEGTYQLSMREIDVNDLIIESIARYSGQAALSGVRLEHPADRTGGKAYVDQSIVMRVIDNLLDNAVSHAGKDGWVRISVAPAESEVELTVADSGPGVPPELRESVFLEWYKGEQASPRQHGIGLYFCRVAVEAHGGSIRVEGSPGDNRFVVALPAAPSRDLSPVPGSHDASDETLLIRAARRDRPKRD